MQQPFPKSRDCNSSLNQVNPSRVERTLVDIQSLFEQHFDMLPKRKQSSLQSVLPENTLT